MHPRAISIENPRDLDRQAVLAVIIEEQRLGAALAFVIAGARADRVHMAPIILGLRMDVGIAVDFAGRGLEDLAAEALGQAEHVDRAVDRGLGRLHRIVLVVDRRGRAGEIEDLVDLDEQRESDVVAQELEPRLRVEVGEIVLGPGEQIVDAQHVVPIGQQPVDQMRAEEAGAAGDQHALARRIEAVGFWNSLVLRSAWGRLT